MNPTLALVLTISETILIVGLVVSLILVYRRGRRQLEDQAGQREEISRTILSNLHHEVRTPLNGALGMVTLLQDSPLSPEQRVFTGLLEDSLTDLDRQLTDMLNLRGAQVDTPLLHPETFPLLPLAHDILALTREAADRRGLSVDYEFAFDPELSLHTDRSKLAHVLLHLLFNAVKFTDEGGVLFCVRHERPFIRFSVTDTGPGIDRETLEQVFTRFVQGDMTMTKRRRGLGIGLAVTRLFVERMGGRITFESRPQKGSVFLVELPLDGA